MTDRTPPTFLAHAQDDAVVVPAKSRMFYDAMRARQVPCDFLELASGGHGLNGYKGPMWDASPRRSLAWPADIGLLPRADNGIAGGGLRPLRAASTNLSLNHES